MYRRYREAGRKERGDLLNEFCVTADYNRKYAIRLLRCAAGETAAMAFCRFLPGRWFK